MNFRLLVFPTTDRQMHLEYSPKIAFQLWQLSITEDDYLEDEEAIDEYGIASKIGGRPIWLQFDNSPTTLDNSVPMHFLMQLEEDWKFDVVNEAPPQAIVDSLDNELKSHGSYHLFLGNAVYFFGTPKPDERFIYIVVQN